MTGEVFDQVTLSYQDKVKNFEVHRNFTDKDINNAVLVLEKEKLLAQFEDFFYWALVDKVLK